MISNKCGATARLAVKFAAPHDVVIVEEDLPCPAANQVLVETMVSAISPGTELLLYRGQWPKNLPMDETISALAGEFSYPVKYGYAAVGKVIQTGTDVDSDWLGRTVFGFNPHESHFVALTDELTVVPESLTPEDVSFLPNMETALSLVMDGQPLIGELVVIFGQGVVGLLTSALLARHPLEALIAVDNYALRRERSAELGAAVILDPAESFFFEKLNRLLDLDDPSGGADLTYEVSGNPSALDLAVAATGFSGRIVVGSWYGAKPVTADLGGRFHRSRISIVSSQVSTLPPALTGRWTKKRRLDLALAMIQDIRPAHLITHRFDVAHADEAYGLLHAHPEEAIQVIFTY